MTSPPPPPPPKATASPPAGANPPPPAGANPPPPGAAPPPPAPKPIGLLANEPVVTLTAGESYSAGTTPTYIFAGSGNDAITGDSGFESTVDYSKLNAGVTVGVGGTVTKGLNGALGTDTLTDIGTIVGGAGQPNIIDASSASSGVAISANLQTHALTVENIPVIGSLSFTVYNFEFIKAPNGADTFVGDNLNDTFIGGAGSTFTTGTGSNTETGGGSKDVFNFGGGHDTITNFSIAGGDVINSATTLASVSSVQGGSLLHFAGGGTVLLQGVSASAVAGIGTTHIV